MNQRYWIGSLVVLALAAISVRLQTRLDSDPAKFKLGNTLATLRVCGGALEAWVVRHKRVPIEQEGLDVLALKSKPVDGWERPIIYKVTGQTIKDQFLLYSVGPNGIDENGLGDDLVFSRAAHDRIP